MATLGSQSFWQVWLTLGSFAGLLLVDAHATGRSRESRTILSVCYLGIAGVLFMFPLYGIAAAAAVAAITGYQCRKLALGR